MGWASGTEAAEKGQVLGVDVKVEDDSHKEVQQAEKEHSLADPLQRPPQQSAHPAGGQWPAQWAQASGCQPEQGGEKQIPQVRAGQVMLPTCFLLGSSFTDPYPDLPFVNTLKLMDLFVFYLRTHRQPLATHFLPS